MKKLLLSLIAVFLCLPFANAKEYEITIKGTTYKTTTFGTTTIQSIEAFESNGFSFEPSKGKGQTAPAYNKAGDLRLYANNTLILTAPAGESITAISFKLSTQGKKQTAAIAVDEGTIATQSKGAATIDWSGDIDKITFTVGAKNEFGTATNSAGQFCFTQIIITTGIDEEPEQPVTPEPNYMIPGGTMHSAGNNYVEQLYSEGATVNIDQSWDSTPSALHQIVEGAVEVAPGATFTLNLKAKKLGPQSSTTVYEDLRFARARIYTDWDADGVFTEDQVIGTESPQAPYNVIGNMDVLDITKQFTVPAEAENTNSRIRVIYHNAWRNKDCTANSTDLVDGMAYDVKVKVGQRSGIDSITGDATDAPAEFYNLQGIRMDGNSLTPGIYIMRQGSKATKVLVR